MRRILLTLLYLCLVTSVNAQNSYKKKGDTISIKTADIRPGTSDQPTMEAIRLAASNEVKLDGKLSESIWMDAPAATQFTQRFPNDGSKPTQRTEVRLLYTDSHIYVGVIAFESNPDSIKAPLFRRDGGQASDWVYVSFDSYNDQRTAFTFAVNPKGVQKDVLYFDDTGEDILWDAVWEAKTHIGENGWTAEIKIPLSQLRYSSKNSEQEWGINFQRRLSRNGEISMWAPVSQNENAMVSKYGRLEGIHDLSSSKRLEITPYISGDVTRAPKPGTGNPYYSQNQFAGNVGGDIKYGVTSDLTLTATINPDFGQVEADPAVINLTANENFFSEKRPFFLEGNDIFQFGNTKSFSPMGNPVTFYSRRIGRTPQGSANRAGVNAEFVDRPDFTTIATAAKLSGKTKNGWSIGFLDAYTLKEGAQYSTPGGAENTFAIEPTTNYMVARTKKDINSGNTYFGGFASAVNRNIEDSYFEDFLRTSAYLGGVDFEHSFNNRNWVTSGVISLSTINGSKEAIELAQRSPVRYYNRVDSEKLTVDPDKTSLSGFATELSIQKRGGDDNWMTSLTYSEVSPGYETNDLGFQNRADYRSINGVLIYRETDPSWLRSYEFFVFHAHAWNYDGNVIKNGYVHGGFMRFDNLWNINYNINYGSGNQYSDRFTRGGPILKTPQSLGFNMNVHSNPNKRVSFNVGTFQKKDASGEFDNNIWVGLNLNPVPYLQINISPQYSHQKDTDQFVTSAADANASNTYGRRYVFANIKQHTLSTSFRLNWTFSPTMSLQTYVRPFISTGSYKNFKEFAKPGTFDFDIYGEDRGNIYKANGVYTVDPDGSGTSPEISFSDPDFNFRAVQGNAVFRWEYMPGSTLYFVWQQQRNDFADMGDFDFTRDLKGLFQSKPTNVFLVKVSYWFGG
ncbi:MAG: hypothetical protein HUJ22_02020 [Gracilimonas sp.]|uniref:DUF5916 domain-containing protein n=1 Tax=Gracilimonas sp. TaxID=1974203 RepID=UPI0019C84E6F|nr:DUF5916 domain-containing protein [Gracilimonas sp.]MBD3615321.1 hypothetical protein [Gracilimonas sp.]